MDKRKDGMVQMINLENQNFNSKNFNFSLENYKCVYGDQLGNVFIHDLLD